MSTISTISASMDENTSPWSIEVVTPSDNLIARNPIQQSLNLRHSYSVAYCSSCPICPKPKEIRIAGTQLDDKKRLYWIVYFV